MSSEFYISAIGIQRLIGASFVVGSVVPSVPGFRRTFYLANLKLLILTFGNINTDCVFGKSGAFHFY